MEIRLKINRKNGLHIRMGAAFISFLQSLIPDKEKLQRTYVIYNGKKVQANNLLSLVALKIKQGDEFTLVLDENTDRKTVEQIQAFFNQAASEVTLHEAVSSIPNGIIVVNKENVIIYVNKAAAELLEKEPQDILNRRADEVIPHSCLHKILQTGKTEITEKQQINHYTVITTRSPILLNDQIIGAVAIFQDISSIEKISKELNEVKELQEKLNLVLQSVTDLIGLTDEKGDFIFSNEGMDKLLKKREGKRNIREIIGKTGWEDLIRRRNPFMKVTKHKGQSFITKVNPVIVEKEIRGTVATMTPLDDVKQLLEKIDIMEQRTRYLEQELSKHKGLSSAFHKIIGNSETLKDALTIADKVAKTHSTVLITGESGTGKELVARAIHEASPRKNHPFIRVNCAAIPPQLMESELFGYEKGAFTGAYKTHRGKFELADKGTIFLDEIGDLNLELQGKLLRVLQEKEIVRIGGFSTIHLDVRVIAATNRDLAKMVEEGTFREDLYYRLNVVPIHLPPLRARKEDIPLLVEAFRVELNARLGKNIKGYEKGFIEALCNYHWPGNIRELQNIMERLFNLADGDYLLCKDLPHYISNPHAPDSSKGQEETIVLSKDKPLHEYEKQIFAYACQFYPSFNQLAKSLGITHKTAASKIRKYKLEHLVGKKYQGD